MTTVVFIPNSPILLHSFEDSVTAWDTIEGRLLYKCSGSLLGIATKRELFLTTKGTWATDTGKKLFDTPELFNWHHRLRVVEIEIPINGGQSESPTDKRWRSYNIDIVDSLGKRPRQRIHINNLNELGGIGLGKSAVDPNGDYIAVYLYVSSYGHELDQGICYDLRTGNEVFRYRDSSLIFVEMHRLIIYDLDEGLRIYHIDSGQTIKLPTFSGSKDRKTVRVSLQNQEMVAVLNHKRNVIFLERINHPVFRRKIQKRTTKIFDIAFNTDGMQLAGALSDGQVQIWDTESGKVIMKLSG